MFKRFSCVCFIVITLFFLGFIAYSNILYAPFVFDDKYYIEHNPDIRDFSIFKNLSEVLSGTRYIGFLSFTINYYFGGLNTFGYHVVNVIIHIFNAILVYFLMVLTFSVLSLRGALAPKQSQSEIASALPCNDTIPNLIAFSVSIIFLVHPIQTESVTYTVQRVESFAAFFYLLAIVLYVKYRLWAIGNGQWEKPITHRLSPIAYCLSIIFTILAMKTKEISFTLPFIIILYEFTFFNNGSRTRSRFLYLIPYLLTLIIIPLTLLFPEKGLSEELRSVQLEDISNLSKYEYFITQLRVIVTYIRLLFLPINQNLDYDYPIYKTFFEPAVILSFAFLLSIFFSAVYLYIRSRKTDNCHGILISFGILWFFITLSVTSSIIPIKDVIFEHRLYLPSIGFILVAVISIFYCFEYLEKKMHRSLFVYLLTIILVISIFFLFATIKRNALWESEESIYTDTVNKSPMKARPHNYLADAYMKMGRIDEAVKEMRIALSLPSTLHYFHHFNLGLAYKKKGLANASVNEFLEAIKLKTDYWEAYYHLGMTFIEIGRLEDAERNIKKALELKADVSSLHNSLGNIYLMQGKYKVAINEYKMAINRDKNNIEAVYNIAMAYEKAGSKDEAIEFYEKFIEMSPVDYKNEMELAKEQIRELQKK